MYIYRERERDYAMAAELLMDKLEHEVKDIFVRAYADDTAFAVKRFDRDAPKLAEIFKEFEAIAGLRLNMKKSVIVPPNARKLAVFSRHRDEVVPGWTDMPIRDHCKYLGFMGGPGRKDNSWHAPFRKFRERVKTWSHMPLGL